MIEKKSIIQKGLSLECQEMLNSHCGYRNDLCYGSGKEIFLNVMQYEVLELGNTDILQTCKKLYGLKLDLRNRLESIQKVNAYFCVLFATETVYCKWLATKENVNHLYSGTECCNEYELNPDALIASDLGPDGALFVNHTPFNTRK